MLPLFLASLILGGGFVIHALHGPGLRAGSLRILGAFLAVFGAAGATFIAGGAGRTVALQVAIAAGVAGTLVPGAASWRARASRIPGEPPLELEGCEGEVVAPLAGASIGRIRVDLGGRWMEFGAVCDRAEATPAGPGARVRVVAVRDGLARVAPVEGRPEEPS